MASEVSEQTDLWRNLFLNKHDLFLEDAKRACQIEKSDKNLFAYVFALCHCYEEIDQPSDKEFRAYSKMIVTEEIFSRKYHNEWIDLAYGVYYMLLRQYAKALTMLTSIFRNPSIDRVARAIAHKSIGFIYYQHKNFALAISEWKRAIDLVPEYVCSYIWIGHVLRLNAINLETLYAAIRYFLHAQKLNPFVPRINGLIGLTYFQARLFERAVQYFQKEITLNPSDHETYFFCARSFFMIGKMTEGDNMLHKGYEKNPQTIAEMIRFDNSADQIPMAIRYKYIGIFLAETKCYDLAMKHFTAAIETDINCLLPDLKQRLTECQVALVQTKRAVYQIQYYIYDHFYKPGGLGYHNAKKHFYSVAKSLLLKY